MAWFSRKKRDTVEVHDLTAVYTSPPMETPSQKLDYRLAGANRDAFIVDLVQRFQILTSDLIIRRVALEHFEGLGSSHNILNRLTLLVKRKEVFNLGRIATGHIAYGSRPIRGGAKRHLNHDLGVARFGITLEGTAKERGLHFTDWICDQATLHQERKQGERPCVPDSRFLFEDFQYFMEFHSGSQDSERTILEKLRSYKRHYEELKSLAKIDTSLSTRIRVLFVCARERDVAKLADIIVRNYGETMLFWTGWGGAEPLSEIWRVGTADKRLYHLA